MANKKQKYETDIIVGERYRDTQTGLEGTVTAITFWQHSCERVNLEVLTDGKIQEYGFDAPRMEHIATGKVATTKKTGGPGGSVSSVATR